MMLNKKIEQNMSFKIDEIKKLYSISGWQNLKIFAHLPPVLVGT